MTAGSCLASLLFALAALARGQDIYSGSSGGFSLQWTPADIRVNRSGATAPPVSFRRFAEAQWKDLARDANGRSLSAQTTYRVLSFAGPYLSVETGEYCDCGGAHPTSHIGFQAIDLRETRADRPKPLRLTELFPEKAIVAALNSDKIVAAALKETDTPAPDNLAKLVDAVKYQPVKMGECEYNFSENFPSEFALYDFKAGRVAVRISLSHAAEICRGQMVQVGIELPAPEALKPMLEAAKAKSSGFLMVDAAKIAGKKQAAFEFSSERK
jgi:hypothetical protein